MITCPKCKATNEDAAKFCNECGTTLTRSMASKAGGVVSDQAKKIGDNARRTAENEFQNGVNTAVNGFIRNLMAKIFGK